MTPAGRWLADRVRSIVLLASGVLSPVDREWVRALAAEHDAVPGWRSQLGWAVGGLSFVARRRMLRPPAARHLTAMSGGAVAWVALVAAALARFRPLAPDSGTRARYLFLSAMVALAYVAVARWGSRSNRPGRSFA